MPPYDDFDELAQLDQEISRMVNRRRQIAEAASKAMDPKDERLTNMAYEAGVNRARYVAESEKNGKLEKRLAVLKEQVETIPDLKEAREAWKERAFDAEGKLDRIKKRNQKKKARNQNGRN